MTLTHRPFAALLAAAAFVTLWLPTLAAPTTTSAPVTIAAIA